MIDDAEMTDAEVVKHLRAWVVDDKVRGHDPFAWPTDACGYEQHARFVRYRNANWRGRLRGSSEPPQRQRGQGWGSLEDWWVFVLAYADRLEAANAEEPER